MFSRRTDWELTPNALTRALADRRAGGGAVVDLTITNPTAVGFRYATLFYAGLFDASIEAYEPRPFGLESAREAVASYYRARGCACDAAAVWLTVPILLYWISRMWVKAHRGEMHDDPVVFALSDGISLASIAAFIAVMAAGSLSW